LSESGIRVQRVSGKAVSDYHEIFDGVPSQHDGKDAAMLLNLLSTYGSPAKAIADPKLEKTLRLRGKKYLK